MEIRYIPDAAAWESWRLPSDKGHRDQLRRIVDEWQQQKALFAGLSAIHPDVNYALATVLQSHELMSRATVTMTVALPQSEAAMTVKKEPKETEDVGFEFEESVDC